MTGPQFAGNLIQRLVANVTAYGEKNGARPDRPRATGFTLVRPRHSGWGIQYRSSEILCLGVAFPHLWRYHTQSRGGGWSRYACDGTTTLVTGGPPKNLGGALALERFTLGCWVAQGGFAGEGVEPPERQLVQFRGRTVCPSFNFDGGSPRGSRRSGLAMIGLCRLVSKNVCHGVFYDAVLHAMVGAVKQESRSLGLIWRGMEAHLRRHPAGKKVHDPLAACCAIDPAIGTWAEVEMFHEPGGWGARLASGTATFIITGYDRERFLAVLTAH
jgi:hypothetical protein